MDTLGGNVVSEAKAGIKTGAYYFVLSSTGGIQPILRLAHLKNR
jgi:hypothetical protein